MTTTANVYTYSFPVSFNQTALSAIVYESGACGWGNGIALIWGSHFLSSSGTPTNKNKIAINGVRVYSTGGYTSAGSIQMNLFTNNYNFGFFAIGV